jgi:hypothetical protein
MAPSGCQGFPDGGLRGRPPGCSGRATPGGVGGYHAAVQFALTDIFHVPLDVATGVALIAHAVSFVPISIIGFAFFATSPLQKGDLRKLAAEPSEPADLG